MCARIVGKNGKSYNSQDIHYQQFVQNVLPLIRRKRSVATKFPLDYTEKDFIDALTKTLETSHEKLENRSMFVSLGYESLYIKRDRDHHAFVLMNGSETRTYREENVAALFIEIANMLGVDSEDFDSKK